MIYLDNEIELGNKNELLIQEQGKSSKTSGWVKEDRPKEIFIVKIHLYEGLEQVKLIYCDRNQISYYLGWGMCGDWLQLANGNFWGLMNVFYILNRVLFTHVYAIVKMF